MNLKNKTITITGGTGSFGSLYLKKIISSNCKEIRILSRDEEKQNALRYIYPNKKIKFIVCDVRDFDNIKFETKGTDLLIHAAALKQVPSCEFYPSEALKTNTIGTENVAKACIQNNVRKMILLSTDKAVYPINAMGTSKAFAEKILLGLAKKNVSTTFNIIRYGNVIASRGSIVPRFIDQIKKKKKITVTHHDMTRFVMLLNDAYNLLNYSIKHGKQGEIIIQKAKSLKIIDLADAVAELMKVKLLNVKTIGIRHGEKLHEVLASEEEMMRCRENKKYIHIPLDGRGINYEIYFDKGKKLKRRKLYSSNNTKKLSKLEIKKTLLKDMIVRSLIK